MMQQEKWKRQLVHDTMKPVLNYQDFCFMTEAGLEDLFLIGVH